MYLLTKKIQQKVKQNESVFADIVLNDYSDKILL